MSPPRDDGHVHLADYVPPAWRIRHADLEFDLDPDATEVRARLSLEPDPDQPGQPLQLDGEDLELLSVAIDGRPLPAYRYHHDAAGLRIDGLAGARFGREPPRVGPNRDIHDRLRQARRACVVVSLTLALPMSHEVPRARLRAFPSLTSESRADSAARAFRRFLPARKHTSSQPFRRAPLAAAALRVLAPALDAGNGR